mgnify:FL=1
MLWMNFPNDLALAQIPMAYEIRTAYDDRRKAKNHVAVSMKFRLRMDRRAGNNVPSTEMPFWKDVPRMLPQFWRISL